MMDAPGRSMRYSPNEVMQHLAPVAIQEHYANHGGPLRDCIMPACDVVWTEVVHAKKKIMMLIEFIGPASKKEVQAQLDKLVEFMAGGTTNDL